MDAGAASWIGSMAEAYEQLLVPAVFRPFAADLAARCASRRPRRILELAAGTGVLTQALTDALPSSEVVATDLSEAMVELGRTRAPSATWRQADAQELPFDDGAFDLVACQFGVMFLPDRATAFAGVRRVLEPGGAVVCSVWGRLEDHRFQEAVQRALERTFPDDPPRFLETGPHGCADPDALVGDLEAGGLRHEVVARVTLEGRAPSAASLAAGYCLGTPLRAQLEARGGLDAAVEAVTAVLTADLGEGPVAGDMTAYVVTAISP